jgi:hypothetical protein
MPEKSKSCRYDFLIEMSFSWGAFRNPIADANKEAGIEYILKNSSDTNYAYGAL